MSAVTSSAYGRRKGTTGGRRRTAEQIKKDAQAADLYRKGMNYQQVADEMGWRGKSSAYRAIQRAIADITQDHFAAGEALHLMLERIQDRRRRLQKIIDADHYLAAPGGKLVMITDPVTGDEVPALDSAPAQRALTELRHLDDQEARLLDLNPPAKARVEVITAEQVEAEQKRIVARLVAEGELTEAEAAVYALPAVPGAA